MFSAIGIYHPKCSENIGTLIRSAYSFGAHYVFTIGRRYKKQSSAVKTDRHIPVINYPDYEAFQESQPVNSKIVMVELTEHAESIETFKHPNNAIYLLGAEDGGIPPELMRGGQVIKLPGKYILNVASAGTVVLYDRWKYFKRRII